MILLVLVSVVLVFVIHTQKPTQKIYKDTKISTIKEAYAYADDYAKRYLGNKYELYVIEGRNDKDFNGEIGFIYTRRVKYFPDAFCVIIDTCNNRIEYEYYAEANRLLGGNPDQCINIQNWNFNIETALTVASELGIDYDEIQWHTVYEDKIAVFFLKNGHRIDQLDFNVFTAERITDKQVYIPDFIKN